MKHIPALFLLLPVYLFAQTFSQQEIAQWKKQAKRVTIIRDTWGVPHVYGKRDADCVFGLMYAQCEDNYWQIEESNIRKLGRAAELYGEKELENDVNRSLFECQKKAKRYYAATDDFTKSLCNAGASGINYFLYTHPHVERRLLNRYEPWYFLVPRVHSPLEHGILQSEIRRAFNQTENIQTAFNDLNEKSEMGSNAIAIAPIKSKNGHSMLLTNPHDAFFGTGLGAGQRYEAHLISEQGLNVSGFSPLSQFYIHSGFNSCLGWAHTSSDSDFEDVYLERFNNPADSTLYQYGSGYRKATFWYDTIIYKSNSGLEKKVFLFRKTHHGPVVAVRDSFLVTIKAANEEMAGLISQRWKMGKARNFSEFIKAMNMRKLDYASNTMYADRFGNIAYWNGNVIPKRNPRFKWNQPVNGSDPQTEWHGMHSLDELVHIINPASGWIQNTNYTPYASAGSSSPKKADHPAYMASEDQSFRAVEAIRLLSRSGKLSFLDFKQVATSTHLPMMAWWMPQVIQKYDRLSSASHSEMNLTNVVDTLRNWDYRFSKQSKATTIGVFWYMAYADWVKKQLKTEFIPAHIGGFFENKILPAPDSIAIQLLVTATDSLKKKFGTTFIAWGDINRLQRIHSSGTLEKFSDSRPSLPVAAVPGRMGSLFSFLSRAESGQKKMYGYSGNTYVAIIEFGEKLRAVSVNNFGQSADPNSAHYFDQAPLYAEGKFKDVNFYKKDILKNKSRQYHPGE